MSNSKLVNFTRISPHSSMRTAKIDKITPHHMACDASIELLGAEFCGKVPKSSTYGIGSDGRIGRYLDESRRPFTSNSWQNDNRAITIEVANDGKAPDWHVSDAALASLIDLCVDICQRNGIKKLIYTGDTTGNMTMHKWFAPTGCPGPYLGSKFPYIAEEVNKRLSGVTSPDIEVEEDAATDALNVGDKISLLPGAKYTTGKAVPDWVMKRDLYVRDVLDGGIVKFSIFKVGAITGFVDRKYVLKEGQAVIGPVEEPEAPTIEEPAPSVCPYLVKVSGMVDVRAGAGSDYKIKRTIHGPGIYTVVKEKNGFGELKAGGWLDLSLVQKV